MQQRIGIGLLRRHRRGVRRRVHRQVEPVRRRRREAEVFAAVPLHRRAGAGAEIAALLRGQIQIPHSDLVAVIEERHARHGEQKGIGKLQLPRAEVVCGADRIVIAGDEGDVTAVFRRLILFEIGGEEAADVPVPVPAEIAVVRFFRASAVIVAHQRGVARPGVVEAEGGVETAAHRQRRLAPLRHQRSLRIFRVQHGAHVAPDGACAAFPFVVEFDQGGGHIHTEAVAAPVEPEAHHVLHRLPRRNGGGVIGGLLPVLPRLQKTVVQRRLTFKEVQRVSSAALALSRHIVEAGAGLEAEIRPDVAVAVFVPLRALALPEPGVLLRGVTRHEIQQHAHPALVRFGKQAAEVLVRTVARRHQAVIPHIVARVLEGGIEAGVDP